MYPSRWKPRLSDLPIESAFSEAPLKPSRWHDQRAAGHPPGRQKSAEWGLPLAAIRRQSHRPGPAASAAAHDQGSWLCSFSSMSSHRVSVQASHPRAHQTVWAPFPQPPRWRPNPLSRSRLPRRRLELCRRRLLPAGTECHPPNQATRPAPMARRPWTL